MQKTAGTLAAVFSLTVAMLSAVLVVVPASSADAQVEALFPTGDVEWVDVIVVLDDSQDAGLLSRRTASMTGGTVAHTYHFALNGFNISLPKAWIPLIEAIPGVAYIEPNMAVQVDVQQISTGLERIGGRELLALDGSDRRVDVDIAVVDTGIDREHPDLNVVDGVTCLRDGFGGVACVDDAGDDDMGHGTHVAGIIGALDNGDGVVGVAPGARLHAVKTLDSDGNGDSATIVAGLDWVVARADTIDVINMSLGGLGFSQAQYDAVQRAVDRGIPVVAAAGNSRQPATTQSPGAFDNTLTVSALADFNGRAGGGARGTCRQEWDDWFASFSNFGDAVDLIAPGVCVLSLWPVESGSIRVATGTSMAAPHAAGALGLLASNNKPSNASEVFALYDDLKSRGTFDWWGDLDDVQEPLLNITGIVPTYVGDDEPQPQPEPTEPELPPGTYSYFTGVAGWYWGMQVTYYNYWGGGTSGIWSNTLPGECTIPAGEISCSFGQFAYWWMPDLTWTGDDGTVLTGTP